MKKDEKDKRDLSNLAKKKGGASAPTAAARLPGLLSAAAWEKEWERHWTGRGETDYELPEQGRADHEFLTQVRTPAKERERLKRINQELENAFTHITDCPKEAVDLIVRAMPAEVKNARFKNRPGGGKPMA